MIVNLAVAQKREEAIDLFVGDRLAKADAVNVCNGNQHGRVVGHDAQVKKTARRTENSFFFDAFNDTEPMVRVDDLVADLECHVSPVAGRRMGRSGIEPGTAFLSIAHLPEHRQRKMPGKWAFCSVRSAVWTVRCNRCRPVDGRPPKRLNPVRQVVYQARTATRSAPAVTR